MANRNVVDILIRARDEASRVLDQASREIRELEEQAQRSGPSTASALQRIEERATSLGGSLTRLGVVWSAAITTPLTALGAIGLRSTMQLETFQKSLNVLVGDAEKAKEVFDRLYEFDTQTTFSWPSLSKATTLLAAFNVEADAIVPTLGRLGDISAGVNMNIDELAEIFGKAKVQGRLFMEDINQLTGRGIPVIQEFAAQFGVTEDAVRQLVSSGQVNFQHLERAIISLTSEGGRFHNLMQEQGDTTAGRLLQLRKEFEQVTDVVGAALIPMVDDLIGRARELVEWFVELDENQQQQIVNIGLLVAAVGPLAIGFGSVATAVGKVVAAIRLLAASNLLGPAGWLTLAAAATTALVAAMAGREGRRKDSLVAAMEETATAAAHLEDPLSRVGTSFDALADQLRGRALESFLGIRGELAALVADSSNAAEALLKIQLGTQLTGLFGTTFSDLNVRAALNAAGASMYGDRRIQGAEQQVTALLQRGQFDEAVRFLDMVVEVLESGGHIASNALAEVNDFRQQVQNARELARTAFTPAPAPTPRVTPAYTPSAATPSGGASTTSGSASAASAAAGAPPIPWLVQRLSLTAGLRLSEDAGQAGAGDVNAAIEAAKREADQAVADWVAYRVAFMSRSLRESEDAGTIGTTEFANLSTQQETDRQADLAAQNQAEIEARRQLVEQLTTISSDKGALGNFGAALFGLAADNIPVLGAALDGFAQGGPVGAVVAVFTELLSQSDAFVEFIQAVNEALAPLAEMIGLILSPVLKALATVLGWVVDAIIGVYNFLLGWLFGRVERDKQDSEQTAPQHSNRAPTLREVDYSSVGQGVQLAVATPILEAAQLSLLAANQQVVFADRLDGIYSRVEAFYTRLFEQGITVVQPPAAAGAAGALSRAAIVRA